MDIAKYTTRRRNVAYSTRLEPEAQEDRPQGGVGPKGVGGGVLKTYLPVDTMISHKTDIVNEKTVSNKI